MRSIHLLIPTLLLAMTAAIAAPGAVEKASDDRDRLFQERTYLGKPITYWLQAIRERDQENLSNAFDAIYSLGPDAWVAVPDLTRVVAAPFDPIDINRDSKHLVAAKVYDIAVRSEAIEALGWIGEPAAPSTAILVQWALARRIVPAARRTGSDYELFIELVTMDAEQRMRVAGAVSRFGQKSFPMIAGLLSSSDPSRRKLGVAILSQDALPVAADLLRSEACNDRQLGLSVLKDMNVVVDSSYLDELAQQIRETCSALTKAH
jgi:hypothetical protein